MCVNRLLAIDNLRELLGRHQTLGLINKGHTAVEIAEMLQFPRELDQLWHLRGYYGTVSHGLKVRAVASTSPASAPGRATTTPAACAAATRSWISLCQPAGAPIATVLVLSA